jgi:serine/threonine protein kinase
MVREFTKLKPRGSVFQLFGGDRPCLIGAYSLENAGEKDLFDLLDEMTGAIPTFQVMMSSLYQLQILHRKGCIHNDIKPDNIVGTQNQFTKRLSTRIIDFGAARRVNDADTGIPLGTFYYMPPEMLKHGTSSFASDIYMLGMTFRYIWFDKSFAELIQIKTLDDFVARMKLLDCVVAPRFPSRKDILPDHYKELIELLSFMTAPAADNRMPIDACIYMAEAVYLKCLLSHVADKNQHPWYIQGFTIGSDFCKAVRQYRTNDLGDLSVLDEFTQQIMQYIELLPENNHTGLHAFKILQMDECLQRAVVKAELVAIVKQVVHEFELQNSKWKALREEISKLPENELWMDEMDKFEARRAECECSLDAIQQFSIRIKNKICKISDEVKRCNAETNQNRLVP